MLIRPFTPKDTPAVVRLWNRLVLLGDVPYCEMDEEAFTQKFLRDPNHRPELMLTGEENGQIAGFIHGVSKRVLLPNETESASPGYITVVMVDPSLRRRGIAGAMVREMETRFSAMGKRRAACMESNPVNLPWRIPGTPGHDHNNAPGVDVEGSGSPFFKALGYRTTATEQAMYLDLKEYVPCRDLKERQEKLLAEGIYTGRYHPEWDDDFDRMCDRIPSDYWRAVLRAETDAWKKNAPCTDLRFLPDGRVPNGPRILITANCDHHIVGFTGPVDLQASGRGYFCGICTDPAFARRGIATVLFNLLMQEFILEGAAFSTLFTGTDNPARFIYERAGFTVKKRFDFMEKILTP